VKIVKMYDVLKTVKVAKSNKDGSVIFLDDVGRVYFIDSKKNSLYNTLSLETDIGKPVLVWVTKELDNVGFVSMSMDGVLLSEYISNKMSDDDDFKERCLGRTLSKDETQLFNYMYNHDIGFRVNICISDKYTNKTTLDIRAEDTFISYDPNIKTPTMLAVAREYIIKTYSK